MDTCPEPPWHSIVLWTGNLDACSEWKYKGVLDGWKIHHSNTHSRYSITRRSKGIWWTWRNYRDNLWPVMEIRNNYIDQIFLPVVSGLTMTNWKKKCCLFDGCSIIITFSCNIWRKKYTNMGNSYVDLLLGLTSALHPLTPFERNMYNHGEYQLHFYICSIGIGRRMHFRVAAYQPPPHLPSLIKNFTQH